VAAASGDGDRDDSNKATVTTVKVPKP